MGHDMAVFLHSGATVVRPGPMPKNKMPEGEGRTGRGSLHAKYVLVKSRSNSICTHVY